MGQHKNLKGNDCIDGIIASAVVIEKNVENLSETQSSYTLYLEHFNCGVLPKLGTIFFVVDDE